MGKKALGRGIDALFGDSQRGEPQPPRAGAASEIVSIPLDRVSASPEQPRRGFDEAAIRELADSIRKKGVLQPIIVTPAGDRYTIVAGERRWRAARLAGLDAVPALVRELDAKQRLEIALIENLQREDLDPVEEARAYRHLMEVGHASQEEVAELVGKDRSTVANSLRLLKLPAAALEALERGDLTAGHARALLSVVNPADQQRLLERTLGQGLSVRQAEELAARMNSGSRAKGKKERPAARRRDSALESVEKELFDRLGTKVEIKGDRRRGRIEVSYYSADDLDRIIEIIGAK